MKNKNWKIKGTWRLKLTSHGILHFCGQRIYQKAFLNWFCQYLFFWINSSLFFLNIFSIDLKVWGYPTVLISCDLLTLKAISPLKTKKDKQTFSKNEYIFLCFFWIYMPILVISFVPQIPIEFTKYGSTWWTKGSKKLTTCWLKNKFHGINLLWGQWVHPKTYNYSNPNQLLDLCCSVLQLILLDCGYCGSRAR